MVLIKVLILIFCIEATTNIISKSFIFKPIREFFFNHSYNRGYKFLHNILDCPYCTSVWISLFYTIMFILYINNLLSSVFLWFFISIALHRASNVLHFFIDRIDEYHILIPDE